ncbi:hypothetical protein ACIBKZ_32230 [Streptomyces sp. NPDC050421]|uniref:hypothetical protein n=1 Tax=unclassified Streptomyces TaxID=2593676 RepID=UPI0037A51B2B
MNGITSLHTDRHDDLVIEDLVQEAQPVTEASLCICWVTSVHQGQTDSAVSATRAL